MRIQIKTLQLETIEVEIVGKKTVIDLKKQLHKFPEVNSPPELQSLNYNGQVLKNDLPLSSYKIKNNKPLHIITSNDVEVARNSKSSYKESAQSMVNMGYAAPTVWRALTANINSSDQAIQFLNNEIPTIPSTPENDTSTASSAESEASTPKRNISTESSTDSEISPSELLRVDPGFQRLKGALFQDPQFIHTTLTRVTQSNPDALRFLSDNCSEFLSMLCSPVKEAEGIKNA